MRHGDALKILIDKFTPGKITDNDHKSLISSFARMLETDVPLEIIEEVISKLESLTAHPEIRAPRESISGGPEFEVPKRKKEKRECWIHPL